MTSEHESEFPLAGTVLCLGLPAYYLVELNDWWLAGGRLDPNAGCTTEGLVTKCWWTQDLISQAIQGLYALIVPPWNSLVANVSARVVISGVVVLIYAALVMQVMKHLYAWLHRRSKV